MQVIAQLFLLCLCFLMFKVKRETKLAILLLAAICLDCVGIPFIPFGGAKFILCNCFILSELSHIKTHLKSIKHTIIKSVLLSMMVATLISAINSPHYDNLMQYARLIILELTAKYFVICYAFLSIKEEKELQQIFRLSFYGLLILTGFGILNYITKHAIFIDEMFKGMILTDVMEEAGSKFTYSERFRVQAMFSNPFNYGYICIILLLFFWYGYSKSLVKKKIFYTSIFCCMFGIITCGCRTNILCTIIGILIYILIGFNSKKTFKYILIGALSGTILISCIPALQEKISETLTVFDKDSSQVSGSSIDMRVVQYSAVLSHIKDHEWFGRGIDYFLIDMRWREGKQYLVDEDLYGLEGVIMNHLLERGIIGVAFYAIFYISLLIFIYKHRKSNKEIAALCISTLSVYLAFANMTGELNSVFPTLLIIGCGIKLIYITFISKKYYEIQYNNPSL